MSKFVKISFEGKEYEYPVIEGSEGEKAIDISKLRAQTGLITLDESYGNTGSCTSAITFIDGDQGILRYRGIPIEELAEKSTFLETSYLLINGALPTSEQLKTFTNKVTRHTLLHEEIKNFYNGFPRDAHPMSIMASVISSLSAFYQHEDGEHHAGTERTCIRLLAKAPTIAAFAYKKSIGQPFVYPDNSRSYCNNFLNMMFSTPAERYEVDPEWVRALDMLLILHADHEQNCSTSTVRLVRSSLSNLYACIASGVCALWGPRHGGANQSVIEMLESIRAEGGNVSKVIERAKQKDSNFKLMGFGHRVYKNFDPRAKIIKEQCHRLFSKFKISDPLLDIALELEAKTLADSYFVERKLYPNVDFYSGIIYKAMGIPVPAFPVMFALGRMPGWLAHAIEFNNSADNRIGRPRQIYTGETKHAYVPIEQRG